MIKKIVSKKTFKEYVRDTLKLYLFDKEALYNLSTDKKFLGHAMAMSLLAGVAFGLGLFFLFAILSLFNPTTEFIMMTFFIGIGAIIIYPIMFFVSGFLGAGLYHVIALALGGKGKIIELYKPLAAIQVGRLVLIIPLLGLVIDIFISMWTLVASVFIIKEVHKLSWVKAIIVVVIPILVLIILYAVIISMSIILGS